MSGRLCSMDGCGRPHLARGYCTKHYRRWRRHGDPVATDRVLGDDSARFWSKVDKAGPIPTWAPFLGPCWLWLPPDDGNGYGQFHRKGSVIRAHRFAYEDMVGPIPDGLELDHLCRVRRCVNPSHLEPVTTEENLLRGMGPAAINARKTHCPQGHPYDEANTYRYKNKRGCRACVRERRTAA